MLSILKSTNLALAFLLELCLLAALVYWGFTLNASIVVRIIAGIGLPALIAVIWGIFEAPRASRPLPEPWHLLLKLVLFLVGVVALFASGQHILSIIFTLAIIINLALAYTWKQETTQAT